ncbi:M15 family metallopeptidase [Cellulomonas composti]|uniref:M15 family metallopeptidase n=1 Tax=Cellulomonas composti TaxID=266130 RepID=UPI001649D6EB|nr:M15 family metallopeptidase [Cellulomonas composti]
MNRRTGRQAWLLPDAAASYERMKAAGMPAGCVSDAGRTHEEQRSMYDAWKRGELDTPSVAFPGTSKHESGRALDLAEPARTWVRTHGDPHGWLKDHVAREPWHQEYLENQDDEEDEDDMATLTDDNLHEISLAVWGQKLGRTDISMHDVISAMRTQLQETAALVAALDTAIERLAAGESVDMVALRRAARRGAERGVESALGDRDPGPAAARSKPRARATKPRAAKPASPPG